MLEPGRWLSCTWSRGGRETGSISARVDSLVQLRLIYRSRSGASGDWEDVEQPIRLDWTACNYGGSRPWFLCPRCRWRVALLYAPGRWFACRRCHDLAYASTRESDHERLLTRAQHIRERLGGSRSILAPFPEKPKGMHQTTYDRLMIEYYDLEHAALSGAIAEAKRMTTQLEERDGRRKRRQG